ncbi:MAG: nucleotidyltransferase domain-containing protein [Ignavibacteriae bacterium]|nr:nucleotidyltransferase domain-containing protein [Ignavibacteriota bacterium]
MNVDVGLSEQDTSNILEVLEQFPEVDEAVIYGSRAKGNYRSGSDVDIALKGNQLTYNTIVSISFQLNEDTLLPYHFDVTDYSKISNSDLREHIDRVGKKFYSRQNQKSR